MPTTTETLAFAEQVIRTQQRTLRVMRATLPRDIDAEREAVELIDAAQNVVNGCHIEMNASRNRLEGTRPVVTVYEAETPVLDVTNLTMESVNNVLGYGVKR